MQGALKKKSMETNSVSNWGMEAMYSSQQQQLTCSFGSATLNKCTINVFQAPHTASFRDLLVLKWLKNFILILIGICVIEPLSGQLHDTMSEIS